MKNLWRHILCVAITFCMLLQPVAYVQAEGTVSNETNNSSIVQLPLQVNPLYEGLIDEEDFVPDQENQVAAFAEEEITYETDEAKMADRIRQTMIARDNLIELHFTSTDKNDANKFNTWFEKAMAETDDSRGGDYLRWNWVSIGGDASEIVTTSVNGIYYFDFEIPITYYTTYEQEVELDEKLNKVLEGLEVLESSKSDYEKTKAIYDYICSNVTYDYTSLDNLKYTAYAALINGKSVCQGYSALLYRMLEEADIDCRMVSGKGNGGDHGWNISELNGKYYYSDSTWDATYKQAGYEYGYFLKGTTDFDEVDPSIEPHVPAENSFVYNEPYAAKLSETAYDPAGDSGDTDDDVGQDSDKIVESGSNDDETVTWTLDNEGTLVIDGTGIIPEYEFTERRDIKKLIMNDGITGIGNGAFSYCYELKGNLVIPESVTSIGAGAFACCEGLTGELVIPESITRIESNTFCGCTGFTGELVIPERVTFVGNSAFSGCSGFTGSLIIPDSIEEIEQNAFSWCTGLDGELKLSENLTVIEDYSFQCNYNLTGEITIPENVTYIGDAAFASCGVEKLIFKNKDCEIRDSASVIPEETTIVGYQQSTAHEYADKYVRKFECIDHTLGDDVVITKKPTCMETGEMQGKCSGCDTLIIEEIAKTDHEPSLLHSFVQMPDCENGAILQKLCKYDCGHGFEDTVIETWALGHKHEKILTKATTKADGTIKYICSRSGCFDEDKSKAVTIYKPSKMTLSTTTYTYDGKTKKPSVTITDSKGKKISSSNYSVSYPSSKNVGKYTVKVTFKGNYSGTMPASFVINPKGTSMSSVSKASKAFTAKWKKQSTQVTGYQIQYSTSKSFKSAKTVTVSSYKTTSKKVTKLKAKTTYYVRVRTYKTVGKTKFYSGWSSYKSVKTK